jgi:hypothetical protein
MVSSRVRADQLVGALARACAKKLRKRIPWCMIRAKPSTMINH